MKATGRMSFSVLGGGPGSWVTEPGTAFVLDLQKKAVIHSAKVQAKQVVDHGRRRASNVARARMRLGTTRRAIEEVAKAAPQTATSARMPGLKRELRRKETKLAELKAAKRWFTLEGGDSVKRTVYHEMGHMAYYERNLGYAWKQALKKHGVTRIDMVSISEYALRNRSELFAEVAVYFTEGLAHEIPKNLLAAFEEVLGRKI